MSTYRIRQHKLRYILCPRCHGTGLLKKSWDRFRFPAVLGRVCSSQVEIYFNLASMGEGGLVNTFCDAFCVLAGIGCVCQHMLVSSLAWEWFCPLVEMHFVSSLAWDFFVQTHVENHFGSSLALGLVNTTWDTFFVIAGKGGVESKHAEPHFLTSLKWRSLVTHVDTRFVSTLSYEGCGQHILDIFRVLTGMGCVWSRKVEICFVFSLAWVGFCQHKLRCSICPR